MPPLLCRWYFFCSLRVQWGEPKKSREYKLVIEKQPANLSISGRAFFSPAVRGQVKKAHLQLNFNIPLTNLPVRSLSFFHWKPKILLLSAPCGRMRKKLAASKSELLSSSGLLMLIKFDWKALSSSSLWANWFKNYYFTHLRFWSLKGKFLPIA